MRHIPASCADLLPARGRIVVFAFKPFSLSDGAGASERLAGLAVIGIVARVWRAVALHGPSARREPEPNPGLGPVLLRSRFGRVRARAPARARGRRPGTLAART